MLLWFSNASTHNSAWRDNVVRVHGCKYFMTISAAARLTESAV